MIFVNKKLLLLILIVSLAIIPMGFSSNYCFQESANTSNQNGNDGDCNLQYNGSYYFYGNLTNPLNFIDGDYGTTMQSAPDNGSVYINYTIPNKAIVNKSLWNISTFSGDVNYSITSCNVVPGGILQLNVVETYGFGARAECYNTTSWIRLSSASGLIQFLYEDSMNWAILNATYGSVGFVNNAYVNSSYNSLQIKSSELSTLNVSFYNANSELQYLLNATNSNDTTFNLNVLSEGYYLYNATATYEGMIANTSTRNITIDRTLPVLSYNTSSDSNHSYKNRPYLLINVSVFDTNFANQTIYVVNNSNSAIVTSYYTTNATQSLNISITDGNYSYYSVAKDLANNTASSQFQVVTIDTTIPSVTYTFPSDSNNTWVNRSYININSSVIDTNFANQTIYYVNATSNTLVASIYTINATQFINASVADGNYTIYIVANDIAGNSVNTSSSARSIYVDSTAMTHSYTSPSDSDNNYVNRQFILVNSSFVDTNFKNQTIYLLNANGSLNASYYSTNATQYVNFSSLSDATFQYYAIGYDMASNIYTAPTRTVRINTATASISFNANTDADNQYVAKNWIFVNITVNDVLFNNSMIYLYNSSGSVVDSFYSNESTSAKNFTSLVDGRYYFNVTSNNANSTTRTVSLSNVAPNIASVAYYVDNALASCVQNSLCSVRFTIIESFCQDNLTTIYNVNATGGAPIVLNGQLTKTASDTSVFPASCTYSYSVTSNTVGVHSYSLSVTSRSGLTNYSSGNFTVVSAPIGGSTSGGGGGGGNVVLNTETATFGIKPINASVDVTRGTKRILEVQIDNTDNKRLTLQANIVQKESFVRFDDGSLAVSLELLPASGIASASSFVRYTLTIPETTPNGVYYVQIKFSSGEMSATHYLVINVTDSAFTNFIATLKEPVYKDYPLYQVLLTIFVFGAIGLYTMNTITKKSFTKR